MTRDEIEVAMIESVGDDPVLSVQVNTNSKVGIFGLFLKLFSFGGSLMFQAYTLLKSELEPLYSKNNVCTDDWWYDKVIAFQYSASEVQKIIIDNYVAKYETVKEELRIISAISVSTDSPGIVAIKASKNTPPAKLSDTELNQLRGYLKNYVPTGLKLSVRSFNADKLYIVGDLYYDGNYASVILQNVKDAIQKWANGVKNGVYLNSDLELIIKSVEGVKDVRLIEIAGRSETQDFVDRVKSYSLPDSLDALQYVSLSGSLVFEDEPGETIEDRLNLIAA